MPGHRAARNKLMPACAGKRMRSGPIGALLQWVLPLVFRDEPLVVLGRRVLLDGLCGLPMLLGDSPCIGLLASFSALLSCSVSPGVRKRAIESPGTVI